MELAAFKTGLKNLDEQELMALLSDIRASRRPIEDLHDMMERAKRKDSDKPKKAKTKSVASIKQELSPEQLQRLIAALEGGMK